MARSDLTSICRGRVYPVTKKQSVCLSIYLSIYLYEIRGSAVADRCAMLCENFITFTQLLKKIVCDTVFLS